jgi:hypothetical protein
MRRGFIINRGIEITIIITLLFLGYICRFWGQGFVIYGSWGIFFRGLSSRRGGI